MKVICSVTESGTSIKLIPDTELEKHIIQELISGKIEIDKTEVLKDGNLVIASKK